uniref:Uncharacterized protein n=1 Tax=Labrus bergylta TaxID=56723 RepID=A0A3Q3L3Y3_9LABR
MAPFPIIDLLVAGLQLCFPRAHINQQVQIPVQQLHGKVISLQLPAGLLLLGSLRAPVAEQQEAAGLCGAEVERDGSRLLGVPLGCYKDVLIWISHGFDPDGRPDLLNSDRVQTHHRDTLSS